MAFEVCHCPRINLQVKLLFAYFFVLAKIVALHAKSTTFCLRSPKYISIDLNTASLLLGAGPGSNITIFGGFTRHSDSILEDISLLSCLILKFFFCLFTNCSIIYQNFHPIWM